MKCFKIVVLFLLLFSFGCSTDNVLNPNTADEVKIIYPTGLSLEKSPFPKPPCRCGDPPAGCRGRPDCPPE